MSSNNLESSETAALVWFRDDLRVADNPALDAAITTGKPILAVYILDETTEGLRAFGGAQKWFLHYALQSLETKLDQLSINLIYLTGSSKDLVQKVVKENNVSEVFWNRRYGKPEIDIDGDIKESLKAQGVSAKSFLANTLHEPFNTKTGSGGPFRVYSPFWRAFEAQGEPRPPLAAPHQATGAKNTNITGKLSLDELALLPTKPNWAAGWEAIWDANEDGAHKALEKFIDGGLTGYKDGRDFPAKNHFSKLSPFLRFGMISPYQIWQSVRIAEEAENLNAKDCLKFLKELGWREFSYHLLFHFPDIGWKNFQEKFDDFPWRTDAEEHFDRWKTGQTGYPIVDAGMRELWQTGFMHNRIRMVVGSFLVKHLLIDWRKGEEWFWDTLVDGDPANNTASWQWIAGSGADAAPYFRVFNPMLQGQKFDGNGDYVRKFVPEISALPNKYLHAPWEAPQDILANAGVTLGKTYPHPIVDHSAARDRALAAFSSLKKEQE